MPVYVFVVSLPLVVSFLFVLLTARDCYLDRKESKAIAREVRSIIEEMHADDRYRRDMKLKPMPRRRGEYGYQKWNK